MYETRSRKGTKFFVSRKARKGAKTRSIFETQRQEGAKARSFCLE